MCASVCKELDVRDLSNHTYIPWIRLPKRKCKKKRNPLEIFESSVAPVDRRVTKHICACVYLIASILRKVGKSS
jgi:hypothetical protein